MASLVFEWREADVPNIRMRAERGSGRLLAQARCSSSGGRLMLFCLSVCVETQRVILDQDFHGEVLAMVEGRDWKEAREAALANPVMNPYSYVAGRGWLRRRE